MIRTSRHAAIALVAMLSHASTAVAIDLLPDLPDELPRYEITVDPVDWDWLLANPTTDDYVPCVLVHGARGYSAGIRFRGNQRHIVEKSIKVKLDDERIDDQRILNFNHGRAGLPLFLEHAAYGIYRALGYPTPKIQPAALTVNGEFVGVFSWIEPINDDMLEREENFGEFDDGAVYKALDHLRYHGENAIDYVNRYEKKEREDVDEWDDLIRLCRLLDVAPYEEFALELPSSLDVNHAIEWYAIQTILSALDNWCCGNYYLYQHPETRRFVRIPWDYNAWCLLDPHAPIRGGHWRRGDDPDEFIIEDYPGPMSRLLELPGAWSRYRDRLRELADEALVEADIREALDRLHALVGEDVRRHNVNMGRDPDYQISDSAERIASFAPERRLSIDWQLALTGPPEIRDVEWTIRSTAELGTTLGFRAEIANPERLSEVAVHLTADIDGSLVGDADLESIEEDASAIVTLRDDGAHADGAAGDGVFGGEHTIRAARSARFFVRARTTNRLTSVWPGIGDDAAEAIIPDPPRAATLAPNPFVHGGGDHSLQVRLFEPAGLRSRGEFCFYDAGGRLRMRVDAAVSGGLGVATVHASTIRRTMLPGVYFVRYGDIDLGRLVVLR